MSWPPKIQEYLDLCEQLAKEAKLEYYQRWFSGHHDDVTVIDHKFPYPHQTLLGSSNDPNLQTPITNLVSQATDVA